MNIYIDKNNLLTIFDEKIPQTKEYTYTTNGYTFSDFDKGIIVVHKKNIKIIHLKNLGDTMSIVYLSPRKEITEIFDIHAAKKGLYLFDSFDETTGKKYYFLPKFGEKESEEMNKKLTLLGITTQIKKTDKGFFIEEEGGEIGDKEYVNEKTQETKNHLSLLFMLVLLYGKFDIKNQELLSIKANIPLFGQFLTYEKEFTTMQKSLGEKGLFIRTSIQKSNDGIIYQISCNDYEIMKNLAEYYKAIENIIKIPKYELALKTKEELIDFITTSPEIPLEGKLEVIKKLEEGTIKLLTK